MSPEKSLIRMPLFAVRGQLRSYYKRSPKLCTVSYVGESMMKIEMSFTKDELRLLIRVLYTGYYVCDRDNHSDVEKRAQESLVDRFLQTALAYKAMDGIEYEAKSDTHFLDADHEDALLEDYNDFIEETFWDELVFRLGRRDFMDAVGEAKFAKMEVSQRIAEEDRYTEKYRKEIDENGIQ